jgi:hypothetical protein
MDLPPAVLESFLRNMLNASAGVLTQCLDDMPRERMLWVDFEGLRANGAQVLQRVMRFLDLDGSSDAAAIERRVGQVLARVPIHEGSRARLPADESARKLDKLMEGAQQRFG